MELGMNKNLKSWDFVLKAYDVMLTEPMAKTACDKVEHLLRCAIAEKKAEELEDESKQSSEARVR